MKRWVPLLLVLLGILAPQAWGYTPEQKEYLWDGARNSPAGAATEDLGTTRLFINPAGGVMDAFAYDAWGTLIASNGLPQTVYLYTGEQFDPELGFYYFRARYLNTGTGRFWTRDTHPGNNQDPLSLHKYLYCQADPVNGADPIGRWTVSDVLTTTFTIANLASRLYVSYKVGYLIGTGIRFTYDEEMTFDELLDQSLKTGVEIAGGWAIGRGIGLAFNRWIGPLTRKLTPLVWQRAHQLGRAAEASVLARHNLFKNTKTLTDLGGHGDFIPDGISSKSVHEVKNVAPAATRRSNTCVCSFLQANWSKICHSCSAWHVGRWDCGQRNE